MSTLVAPLTPPGVEILIETKKGKKQFNIRDWALGITDFCALIEETKCGILQVGPVTLEFDLTTQNVDVYSSKPLELILGSHGAITHARQKASSIVNALSLFPRSFEHQVLNITIGGAVVTLQKQRGLLEIGGSGVEIK